MAAVDVLNLSIQASPERVFAAIGDIAHWVEWMPGLRRVEWLTEGALGVGSRWRIVRALDGEDEQEEFVVTAWEPGRELELDVDGWRPRSERGHRRYHLRLAPGPGGQGTRLHLTVSAQGDGPVSRLLAHVLRRQRHRQLVDGVQALRRHVDAESR